jgi:hypothetical protein
MLFCTLISIAVNKCGMAARKMEVLFLGLMQREVWDWWLSWDEEKDQVN